MKLFDFERRKQKVSALLAIIGIGVGFGILTYLIFAIIAVFGAIPLYFLWNWLMPAIFGIKIITFWQAWGLVWLTGILFKSSVTCKSSK